MAELRRQQCVLLREGDRLRVREITALREEIAKLDAIRTALGLPPAPVEPPTAEFNMIVEQVRVLEDKIEALHDRAAIAPGPRVRNAPRRRGD
jgi:hypothetical protein